MNNALYYGDNLDVLRESIASESVDLIYLDPPFNSNANYNVLFRSPTGLGSQAQIEAFEDTWHWGQEAESTFDQVMRAGNTDVADLLRALRSFLGENDMMAYLTMMAVRLLELHRVLKKTGSLYLHCDPTAGHYLKILLDSVFGVNNYRSQIVWKRSAAHSDGKQGRKIHGHIHDLILFYTKTDAWTWNTVYTPYDDSYIKSHYSYVESETGKRFRADNLTAAKPGGDTAYEWRIKRLDRAKSRWQADLDDEYKVPLVGWLYSSTRPYIGRYWAYSRENMSQFERDSLLYYSESGMPNFKRYLDEMPGVPLQDLWADIPPVNSQAQERLGYPTQKPVELLERVLSSSSNPGDVVLDSFCGCGTTIHAAQKLGRTWIGIDIIHLAISLIERRLKDAFPGIVFDVHGTPQDLDGARDLASRDKYQFQWWAVSLIDAQPFSGKKKGADGGIDGLIYFRSDAKTTERAVVSVKGGGVSVPMVRDLKGVLDREKAPIGVFLTLEPPTRPMEKEAASAGFYMLGERQYPRLQIITIEQALAGAKPAIPLVDAGAAFKRAAREDTNRQPKLDI